MASMDKKVRYVRCAKCLKLLIEFADVPVYQCGGCGTILQAKYYRAPKESGTLGSLQNNMPDSLPEDPSLGSGTSLEEQIAPSTAADSSELIHVEDNDMISTLGSSSPSAEQNCYQRGKPSNDVETGTKKIASDTAQLIFRSSAEYMAENRSDKSVQTETGKCSSKETDNSPKYIHQGSEDLMLGHKLEEASSFKSSGEYRAESQPDKSAQTEREKCSNQEADNSPKYRHKDYEKMLGHKLEEGSGFISSAESSSETRPEKNLQTEMKNYSNEEAEKSPKYTHQSSEDLMCHKLEEVSIIDQPAFGSIAKYTFESEVGESIKAKCLNEEVGKPSNLSEPGSNSSRLSDKLEESPVSVNHRVTSEEDFPAIEYLLSPNRISQTYEGSVSSLDDRSNDCFADRYLLSPAGSFGQQRILSSDDSKEMGRRDAYRTNKMVTYPPPKLQDHTFNSLSDKHIDRFGSNREESSSRYRIRRLERGTSLDSACSHSVQDRMNYGCSIRAASHLKGDSHDNHENGTSVKIGDLEQDNTELLRKVDVLRHQLNELYDQREGRTRYHTRTPSQQNIFFNHNSRQEFSHDLKPNLVRHPQGEYYRPRISAPQMSLAGESRCSCLRCHSEDHHMQLLPNYRHSGPYGACAYNVSSHPSNDANPHIPIGYGMHDLDSEKLLHKKKRQISKRHCLPFSGAAPFVICDKCLKLLQLPADFLISRRRLQKLQCGACSKILLVSFHSGPCVTQTPSQVFHRPGGIGSDTDALTGHQISDYRADNCPEGDRLSFSGEYGFSFTQSYSTETTPVPYTVGNSSEEIKAREEPNSTLHRLMGYSSATEILYQPSDDDEGYESAEPTRSYSYRRGKPSDSKWRGKEMSSSQSSSSWK